MATTRLARPANRWTGRIQRSFSLSCRRKSESKLFRPPTAPKPVPDVKSIKENPSVFSQNCVDRNYAAFKEYPHRIRELSEDAARLVEELKTPRKQIKEVEKAIAQLASRGLASDESKQKLAALRDDAHKLKSASEEASARKDHIDEEIRRLALALPNLTSTETPVGDEPRLIQYINFDPEQPPSWTGRNSPRYSHVDIGTSLGLMDFTSAATSTGWGWYYLTNEGALLEQALVQYSLSVALRRGWKAVSPPSIVYSYLQEACGYQPRDQHNEQQVWHIEQSEKDKAKPQRSLAGTAEIPLAAMYAGCEIEEASLPLKFVGPSRCYRAEAGARGVDTKGLYRVHEFTKVELFAWSDNVKTDPADITHANCAPLNDLFNELLDIQLEILTSLGLPCRVLEMPTGDLGASATRKRDIEALFPSRLRVTEHGTDLEAAWGEVTSASICTDYQSRRLGTRVRGRDGKKPRYPHTVNGTAMAVPRVLAAILENSWDAKRGVVVVPELLRPWMGGIETIGRN